MVEPLGHMPEALDHMTGRPGHIKKSLGYMPERLRHMEMWLGHIAETLGAVRILGLPRVMTTVCS